MRTNLASLLFVVVAACGGRADPASNGSDGQPAPPAPPPPGVVPNPPPAPTDVGPQPPPPPTGPAAVLFSGDGPAFLEDTWTFDGSAWYRRTGPAPTSRVRHAMTGRAGNVVLFGGAHYDSQMLADTWEWDGTSWHDRTTTSGPSARMDHAMATVGDVVVLYGGEDSPADPTAGTETWTWDGAQWTQRATGGALNPGDRIGHAMASLGGKIVLFGGVGADDATWELDPATWTWTKKTIPGPGDRAFFAMSTLGGKIVLFGGEKDANHFENDTWEYDGTSWTQRMVPGPSARFHHGMTALGSKIVLFGGEQPPSSMSAPWPADTWSWDGSAWTQSGSSGPEGRDVYTLAAP